MKNLKSISDEQYVSIETFEAEDNKPFKFKICVNITDLESACGDAGFLICTNAAKLPEYLSKKNKSSVAETCGIPAKDITVNDVCDYGLYCPLDSCIVPSQKDIESKLSEIDEKLPVYGLMCGFYFDKRVNAIGNTGWNSLNGNIG